MDSNRTGRRDMQYIYESFTRGLHATKLIGNVYGLGFYSEPGEGTRGDLHLVNLDNKLESFIECGEDSETNPQCTHWIWDEKFMYNISFDKDLLEHWNDINNKSLYLVKKFRQQPSSQVNQTESKRHD